MCPLKFRGGNPEGLGDYRHFDGGEALQLPLRFHLSRGIGMNRDLAGESGGYPGVVQMLAAVESGQETQQLQAA